jgi:hypothetical protein
MTDTTPTQTDDAQALLDLDTTARADVLLLPADRLAARESLAAIETGKTWREMETAP